MSELFYSKELSKEQIEEISFNKMHQKGKCKNTVFADGGHRTGFVPLYRIRDGGLPGVICQRICLECGKKFRDTGFIPRAEPK